MGHAHLVLQRQQRLHQLRIVARHRADANLPYSLTGGTAMYGARLGSLAEREPSCDMARHGPSERADVPHGGRKGAGAGVRSPETRRSGRSCRSPAARAHRTAAPLTGSAVNACAAERPFDDEARRHTALQQAGTSRVRACAPLVGLRCWRRSARTHALRLRPSQPRQARSPPVRASRSMRAAREGVQAAPGHSRQGMPRGWTHAADALWLGRSLRWFRMVSYCRCTHRR